LGAIRHKYYARRLQILQMRYAGPGLAWEIVLPKSENGLPNLEESLTPEDLMAWVCEMSGRILFAGRLASPVL